VLSFSLTYIQRLAISEQAKLEEDKGVNFLWAFVVLKKMSHGSQFIAITRDTVLKTGDQLKMLVKLNKNCFVYVFYHSSQGELHMLFPYNLSQFSNDYEVSKNYYIPQGDFVLELDENVGKEKIYLIASAQRIQELENLYSFYKSVEDPKKPEFIENIIHEIRQLRKRHKKFTTEAERPVASIGPIRAHIIREETEFSNLEKIAVEFAANIFFAKTFTIEHK
jgi:hypothetical protein